MFHVRINDGTLERNAPIAEATIGVDDLSRARQTGLIAEDSGEQQPLRVFQGRQRFLFSPAATMPGGSSQSIPGPPTESALIVASPSSSPITIRM